MLTSFFIVEVRVILEAPLTILFLKWNFKLIVDPGPDEKKEKCMFLLEC